tara:strand:+ start:14094 stop:14675 length:582 start_codon:yes stop_codon:yes gene_type:complete
MNEFMLRQGKYKLKDLRSEWGLSHRIPETCGRIKKSGNGICGAAPIWFQYGEWTCGHHRIDKHMHPYDNDYGLWKWSSFVNQTSVKVLDWSSFECSICMDMCNLQKHAYITPCNHEFHFTCLKKWVTRNNKNTPMFQCPLCRASIKKDIFFQKNREHQEVKIDNSSQPDPNRIHWFYRIANEIWTRPDFRRLF